jgi:hypothetical protein
MRRPLVFGALAVFVLAALVASDAATAFRLGAIVLAIVPIGIYLGLQRPKVVYAAFALELGAIPFADVPGVNFPLGLLLAVVVAATAVLQLPRTGARLSGLEWWCVGLVLASTVSLVMTYTSSFDTTEYLKWLIATTLLLSLRRLSPVDLQAFGRYFVYGISLAAAFGILTLEFDKSGRALNALGIIGYGSAGDNLRYVFAAGGTVVRLTGTFIDPNAGGLFLVIGFCMALALFSGARRWLIGALLLVALGLTLSRESILSLLVAVLLFVAFRNIRFGARMRGAGIMALLGAVALAIPAIQDRLLSSLDTNDVGASARSEALSNFPNQVSGHWLFGLGWGRIEFRDPTIGQQVNYVANAPLLSVYRGGLIVGVIFTVILLIGIIRSLRGLRQASSRFAFIGAGFIGLTLVAFQLDFPIVTIYPTTMAFSILLAFLPSRAEPDPDAAAAESQARTRIEVAA